MLSVLCKCEPNLKQLRKQALNKKRTVLHGMPCPLGFDDSHMITCFVKPDLARGPLHYSKSTTQPEVTVGLVSNDQFLSLGLALAASPLEDFL